MLGSRFTLPMAALNLDVMSLFQVTACDLAVLFQNQFVLHMLLPPLLVLAVTGAYNIAHCIKKPKDERERSQRQSTCYKILILIILLIYPGLATRIFSLMRCIRVDGVEDGLVLEADFAVRCFQGEHLYYAIGGFICMGVYVMGIPSVMAFLLWKNRAHLHDKTSEKNKEVEAFLGGLYQQFLFQLAFLMAVLKLAPFEEDDDDLSSFISSLAIVLTCLCGFALSTAEEEYAGDGIGNFLVSIGLISILSEIFIMIRGECRRRRRIKLAKTKADARLAKNWGKGGGTTMSVTKIMPESGGVEGSKQSC
eukprot:g3622.t1